jgi:hypothetical protein
VSIGPARTTIRQDRGPAMAIVVRGHNRTVRSGHSLNVATRRPDLARTTDVVRCQDATATSSQLGAPPLAAVDGSGATDWQPQALPATLTVPLRRAPRFVRTAILRWGEQFPLPPGPNVAPPPSPVTLARASGYALQVSADGHRWRTVATVSGDATGNVDVLRFGRVKARFARVAIPAASGSQLPLLQELILG